MLSAQPTSTPRGLAARIRFSGPASLADHELLAILIGDPPELSLIAAQGACHAIGGLAELGRHGSPARLMHGGLGPDTVARVAAAIELGRRVLAAPLQPHEQFSTPARVFEHFRPRLAAREVEEFWLLLLDSHNGVIREQRVATGGRHSCPVDPPSVLRAALEWRALSFVVVHNHPSGNPDPSPEDIALTARLGDAARLLNLVLLDHVIVGRDGFVSLRERGLLR